MKVEGEDSPCRQVSAQKLGTGFSTGIAEKGAYTCLRTICRDAVLICRQSRKADSEIITAG